MKKSIYFGAMCLIALTMSSVLTSCSNNEEYVDLGLPSGTLWKNANEEGYFSYNEAMEKYNDSVPTKEQWEELQSVCTWSWTDKGLKAEGPNGKSIVLPAAGIPTYDGEIANVGEYGCYLSSTLKDASEEEIQEKLQEINDNGGTFPENPEEAFRNAWMLDFTEGSTSATGFWGPISSGDYPIRLVKGK